MPQRLDASLRVYSLPHLTPASLSFLFSDGISISKERTQNNLQNGKFEKSQTIVGDLQLL